MRDLSPSPAPVEPSPVDLSVSWGDEINATMSTQEEAAASYSSRTTYIANAPVLLLGADPHRSRALIINTAEAEVLVVGTFADVQADNAYPVLPGATIELFVQREVYGRYVGVGAPIAVGVWSESNR